MGMSMSLESPKFIMYSYVFNFNACQHSPTRNVLYFSSHDQWSPFNGDVYVDGIPQILLCIPTYCSISKHVDIDRPGTFLASHLMTLVFFAILANPRYIRNIFDKFTIYSQHIHLSTALIELANF